MDHVGDNAGRPPTMPAGEDDRPSVRLPRPVLAVVFDLDGTLLDTETPYRRAFANALAEFGYAMAPGRYDELVGLPGTARRALLPAMLGSGFPVSSFFAAYRRHRETELRGVVRLKPGVMQALDGMDRAGLRCAIATSASAATAHAHLSAAGLLHRFAAVATRDDVVHGKPAPDSFLHAAARLGVAPQDCLAVEDSPHGVEAAHAARMMVAMIPDTVEPTARTVACCVAILDSLHDLGPLVATGGMELVPTNNRSRCRV